MRVVFTCPTPKDVVVSGRRRGRSATETTGTSGRSWCPRSRPYRRPHAVTSAVGTAMSHDSSFVSGVPRSAAAIVRPCLPARRSLPLVETTVLSIFIRSPISLVGNFTTLCYVPTPGIVVDSGPRGVFCCSLNKYFCVLLPTVLVGFRHTFFYTLQHRFSLFINI